MFARGFKSWCEKVAIQHRRELGIAPSAPLDATSLAKHLGVTVWKAEEVPGVPEDCLKVLLEDDPDSWSAATIDLGDRRAIIMNTAHSKGRQSSDLTHELAHLIIGHKPARVDVSEDGLLILSSFSRDQEDEANWLGGCLLLPREALMHIRAKKLDASNAAKQYNVSNDMLHYRIKVTGVDFQLGRARRA